MERIETTILRHLMHDEDFMRQTMPFLKAEYFERADRTVFGLIDRFVQDFNACPSAAALEIALQNSNLHEAEFRAGADLIRELVPAETNRSWLLTETERFCKDRAVYNGIMQCIEILDGRNKQQSKEALPSILTEALAVSFDRHIGHDYLQDASARFDFYHRVESRIPFDLDMFNRITNGGLPNKTLNVVLAGTGVGKSLFMCHVAASCLAQGKHVLYITLEMAEERIAERIDANLMNLDLDQLKELPRQMFDNRIDRIRARTEGRLIIKEYPTASAHSGHFKSLLKELALKQNFHPDIIVIDYLNICSSSRIRQGQGVNSYTYIKSIAEELRGLAVEHDVPILSATQTTRGGYANTDVDLTDTSESFGLPATVDFMFALISTEELEELNQLMVKQLKNRYNDPTSNRKFIVGVDRAKMKLYDVEASAQRGLINSGQDADTGPINTFGLNRRRDFSDFKF